MLLLQHDSAELRDIVFRETKREDVVFNLFRHVGARQGVEDFHKMVEAFFMVETDVTVPEACDFPVEIKFFQFHAEQGVDDEGDGTRAVLSRYAVEINNSRILLCHLSFFHP